MEKEINHNIIEIDKRGCVYFYGDEGDDPFFNKEDIPELIEFLQKALK